MKNPVKAVITASIVALAAGSAAQAMPVYQWNFNAGQGGGNYGQSNAGGAIQSIVATFNTATKEMTWDVRFSNQITKGFWLAINDGPNPKGHAGELALFYFDASRLYDADPMNNNICMTAYAYNGKNGPDSWKDGNPNVANNQPGDLIKGVHEKNTWINSVNAVDSGGGRNMSFSINATDIINHVPMYPDNNDPWFGTGFDEKIGVWFHPVSSLSTGYEGQGRGKLTSANFGTQGWIDGSNFTTTTIVPAPGVGVLAGVGGLLLISRRRK